MSYRNQHLFKLIFGTWFLCGLLVILTAFTPLELVPLTLENLPRWGFWLLVFPVTYGLKARASKLTRVWSLLPWLLWTPLIVLQLSFIGFWFTHPYNRKYAADHRTPWTKVVKQLIWPLKFVFFQTQSWSGPADYRRGKAFAVRQILYSDGGAEARRVIITPILPGLQWCVPIPYDSVLKAPWQIVDTAEARGLERAYR